MADMMDYLLLMEAENAGGGGGGGEATLINKNISANGTYNASSDSADGYSSVVVNVSNSYAAGDEGKVVSSGALVSQSSQNINANGTYDTTLKNQVVVNVQSGGDYVANDWLDPTKPTGRIESALNINSNYAYSSLFSRRTGNTQVFLTEATHISDSFFHSNTGLQSVVGTKLRNVFNSGCNGATALTKMDMAGTGTAGAIGTSAFNNSGLNVLVIRNSVVCSLGNVNAFGGSCPFASGKAGGTLYVPQALISSYQGATNWSTILGYANNQIKAIEGSAYATKYVDGTTITT